jgi:hypothetical protein
MKSKGIVLGEGHVNHIRSGGSGINPGKPHGFQTGAETVPDRFEGDQTGNRQVEKANGWPANKLGSTYNSDAGNPGDARRERPTEVISESGQRHNDPRSNGNGVMFDGVKQSRDYMPTAADVLDSPVPKGAQQPEDDASIKLNEIRNGVGKDYGADDVIEDSLVKADGVMARS